MKDLEIGTAILEYDKDGKVTHADFLPTLKIDCKEIIDKLSHISNSDLDTTREQAQSVFAIWMSKLTEIELGDREDHEISLVEEKCEKYENGSVKYCEFKLVYRELSLINN